MVKTWLIECLASCEAVEWIWDLLLNKEHDFAQLKRRKGRFSPCEIPPGAIQMQQSKERLLNPSGRQQQRWQHQVRLYLVVRSKHMPAGDRLKRIANLGPGWLKAEREHDAELPGNIPAKPITPKTLACWITGSSLEECGCIWWHRERCAVLWRPTSRLGM